MNSIADRLLIVQKKIASAMAQSGRHPESVQLVAVSKTHPTESVREAFEAGQLLFGESRVQEARVKIPDLSSQLRWHFIGHLQKNKIRNALSLFEMIEAVDSLELAKDINRVATELGVFPKVLLEVNLAGEASKFGFSPDQLTAAMEPLLALDRLQIQGLMTIPPPAPEAEASRPFFAGLREFRDRLQIEARVPLPELSMGMSGDFPVAIQEGATLVRVGTAIFGLRPKPAT